MYLTREEKPKFIRTVSGQLDLQNSEDLLKQCLPYEFVTHNFNQENKGSFSHKLDINLSTIQEITKNPGLCHTNLVYNDIAEYDNEIRLMIEEHQNLFPQDQQISHLKINVAIVDVTKICQGKNENVVKDVQDFNIALVQTYYPELQEGQQLNIADSQNRIVYSEERVYKKIDYEFYHSKIPQGVIGNIRAENLVQIGDIDDLSFAGAIKYSKNNEVPIYVDCSNVVLSNFESIFGQISNKFSGQLKIVYWNLFPLEIFTTISHFTDNGTLNFMQSFSKINELFDIGNRCFLGFTISYFLQDLGLSLEAMALFIKFIIEKDPLITKNILISCGFRYKTELRKYGGVGFKQIVNLKLLLKNMGIPMEILEQIFFINPVNILNWWTEKDVQGFEEKLWQCWMCEQNFPEDNNKFSKNGFDFCTPIFFKKAKALDFRKN